MATQGSILAQKVPRTEEPGGLQSMGSQSWTRLKRLGAQGWFLAETKRRYVPHLSPSF